ncbi:hypothetical protein [Chryseobacterium profundimaris]|uniref:Uncharacterized protein n=1 Tax=Chryseobacterium profundimaris TaxID=1387275 RepID=A0ABY1NSG0_9FLAO|nr:hypothetical protein [Chryseobacterium profundimaris]SMP16416.1 hypothetical protein SAMN06264346_10435 [Chryseobacterium profundimaris]
MSSIEALKSLEKSVEILSKHDFLSKQTRVSIHFTFARFIDKFMIKSELTEFQIKSINSLSKLTEKNKSVFDNNLITVEEYNANGKKLLSKLVKILNPPEKKKKASKMDVYSLRAGLENIDNEN